MGWNIRRISSYDTPRATRRRSVSKRATPALDQKLRYNPYPDEEWSFDEDSIKYNNSELNEIINENIDDAGNLAAISSGLTRYRNHVWNNGIKNNSAFNSKVDILLGKVTTRLGVMYEEKLNGINCQYLDGALWVNGINISMLIDLYKSKPDERAKPYLLSWKNKLSLILSSSNANSACNVWWKVAKDLLVELDIALQCTPDNTLRISAPSGE